MKTVTPLPEDNKIVILHAFVLLRETGYQSDDVGPGLEIIPRAAELVALIQVNHIMPSEPQAHLLVESIHTAQDPK